MYCPNCKIILEGNFCSECGSKLIEEPQSSSAVNISLGDANAISGGINIDSHNITNNTIYERQKLKEEIHQEKILKFKIMCERIYDDGIMTIEEAHQLESYRMELGLNSEEANSIREIVRQLRLGHSQKTINPMILATLNHIVGMARNGKIEMLKQNLPRLDTLAEKYDVEEVQFYYYLILSALYPNKCIELYENRKNDNYWQFFWSFIAYQNTEQLDKAQMIMIEMETWTNRSSGNLFLLAAIDCLYSYYNDTTMADYLYQARLYLEQGDAKFDSILERFAKSLILIIEGDDEKIMNKKEEYSFYFNFVLDRLMQKRKIAHVYKIIPKMPKISLL